MSLSNVHQLTAALLACGPERVSLPLEQLALLTQLPPADTTWCAVLPRIWRDRDETTLRAMLSHARDLGVTAVLIGNIGHLSLVRDFDFALYGDYGLNVFNAWSLQYLSGKGLVSACVSYELRFAQIRDMKKVLPTEAIVYGRLPLMVTENCLTQNCDSCHLDKASACVPENGPCSAPHMLTDRTGTAFPLLPAFGHRTEVENSKVLWLADRPDYRRLGLTYARLRFTTESPEECVSVFRRYLEGAPAPVEFTRGLYERGVE